MISIIQNGDVYEIRFKYNKDVIDLVKEVAGRKWNKDGKFWTIPKDKIGFMLGVFKNTPFESDISLKSDEDLDVNTGLDETNTAVIPSIDISDVKTYVKDGGSLFKHQEDCLKYAIGRKASGNTSGFLLADEMGCIAGSATVEVDLNGRRKNMSLMTLYQKWANRSESDSFYIKSYVPSGKGMFAYLPIRCVLSKGPKSTVKINFTDGSNLICTDDHEVLTHRGWVEAWFLHPFDMVVKEYDDYNDRFKIVQSIDNYGTVEVYDVGVDHYSAHNFVANEVVVHNCGKTLEVINMAMFKKNYEDAKHCLIICCINSAKYNWVDDIKTHTNGEFEGYILGSRIQKRKGAVKLNGSGAEKLKDLETGLMYSDEELNKPLPYFLILNIEALRTSDKTIKKKSMQDVLTLRVAELCNDGAISMIAIDEIHRNASPQSSQGKELLKLKALTGDSVEWIPMTGTPVVNKPTDVYTPMRLIDATDCTSYYKWNQHYCIYGGYGGHNIIGYKNIPELKKTLEPNMLRRTKNSVLDLPPKIHHIEYVENTSKQKKLYGEVLYDITSNIDAIKSELNPLAKLLRLRQVNGCPELIDDSIDTNSSSYPSSNAKINRFLQIVQDIVSNGGKAVVFSNWIAPVETAILWLKKNGIDSVPYTRQIPEDIRELNKHRFINDPSCNVIVGTIGALGTSHTLSVASNVIFLDEPWNAATFDQAEDRCYRLNSTDTVDVFSIITKDTVDEHVHDIIISKRGTSDYIVDGKLNLRDNPELLELLLS